MDLPSARELELEVLLRQRETQLGELRDEAISLRRYLAKQPGPSKTELVTFPPAVLAVLMPHIESQVNHTATSVSATVAGGLNQRMRQLQEENDELYNLLKSSETGKLKDEVRSLRRAVAKLEGALKESHQVISSLSEELEKTHEVLMSTSRHKDLVQPYPRAYSDSPSSYRPDINPSTNSKPPPTGPRAHKRPRLLEPQPSPPARPMAPLPPKPQTQNHSHHAPSQSHHNHHPAVGPMRDRGRQETSVQDKDTARRNRMNPNDTNASNPPHQHHNSKMELDGPNSPRHASPATVRERERAREREKNNKERERRDRESRDMILNTTSGPLPSKPPPANTVGRRNGYSNLSGRAGGGGSSGATRKPNNNDNPSGRSHSQSSSDNRTLQERMGL